MPSHPRASSPRLGIRGVTQYSSRRIAVVQGLARQTVRKNLPAPLSPAILGNLGVVGNLGQPRRGSDMSNNPTKELVAVGPPPTRAILTRPDSSDSHPGDTLTKRH